MTLVQIAYAKRSTIAKVFGPVYAAFALIAGQIHYWWLTLTLVVALGILTVLGVVFTEISRRRHRLPTIFDVSSEGAAALAVEQHAVARSGGKFWWQDLGEPEWFEDLLILWRKDKGISADRASYSIDSRPLREYLPRGARIPEAVELPRKASLAGASGLLTDEFTTIKVLKHDYHLARFVENHLHDYLMDVPNTTCFGADGWIPLPANLCMHAIIELRDRWVLLGLRRPDADYDPLCWSATFEEQVNLADQPDSESPADHTVGDTLRRGLAEEFGVDPSAIRRQELLSISIMRVRRNVGDDQISILNAGVLVCAARLSLTVDEIFDTLSDRAVATDREEHIGWMALRMTRPSDVSALLTVAGHSREPNLSPGLIEQHDGLGIAVRVSPSSQPTTEKPHLWQPTSRQRLYLWSRWTHPQ